MAFTETLRIIIDANTKGFVTATKQAADSTKRMDGAVIGVRQRIGGFAKIAAIGFAGVGIAAVAMGDDFVRAAEESNKVSAQTDAVLKSMGLSARVSAGQIAELSKELSAKSGIDDEVIQSGENVLLTFKSVAETAGVTGGAFDRATAAALDMSVALGQDMQSSVVQVGKALNDPIRGLTSLRRVGVQFTQAQEDQIKAMVAAGDQAGAMTLILGELERQFGGSAEAQATASGKLSVAWENLQETLGKKLLPIVERFATWLTNTGIPALEAMIGWVERNRLVLLGLSVAIATVVIPTLVALAATTIAATWPLLAIGAAVGVLAVLMVKHFDTIKAAFMAAFDWLKRNWPLLVAIITGPMGIAVLAVVRHWNTIRNAFQTGVNFVISIWRTGWNTVRDVMQAAWKGISEFFKSLPGRIRGYFKDAADWLITGGRRVIAGLLRGITNKAGDIKDWFLDLPGKIWDWLGFGSPPKWAIQAGEFIVEGFLKGIGRRIGDMGDLLKWLAKHGFEVVANLIPDIGQNISGFIDLGRQMAAAFGWTGGQFEALKQLWAGESGWNPSALNPSSGAYGIPQALPASKMGPAAQASNANVTARAAAQIAWGLRYIQDRYGDPINALQFWNAHTPHWYGTGGVLDGPVGAPKIIGAHGGEGIFTPSQMRALGPVSSAATVIENHFHIAGTVVAERELLELVDKGNARRYGRNSVRVR